MAIHETSIIDTDVCIGADVSIWQWTHICSGAVIGNNVSIGQGCYIGPDVCIGDRTRIQNNTFIPSGISIASDCFLGPSVVFTNNRYPPWTKDRQSETIVERGASIGANSTIISGITVGENSVIGAGSVVVNNVLPNTTVYGNPARIRSF